MTRPRTSLIVVGHVDHGKSTTLGRLLYECNALTASRESEMRQASSDEGEKEEFAFVMDTFAEERSRRMTMDVTYIPLKMPERDFLLIDAPGHKELIKNMLTGACHADAALLILDVKEGKQEQTARHLSLLHLLGIKSVYVAINKMDLVSYSEAAFDDRKREIMELFARIGANPTAIIPISARLGANVSKKACEMRWYLGPSLVEVLLQIPFKTPKKSELRFPIQDLYSVNSKSLVVGRVESGEISANELLNLFPGDQKLQIEKIHKYPLSDLKSASSGDSIALSFTAGTTIQFRRGQILYSTDSSLKMRDEYRANIFWMQGELDEASPLILHCTTQKVPIKLVMKQKCDAATPDIWESSPSALYAGEISQVVIQPLSPLFMDSYTHVPEMGRFVIEQNGHFLGGGIVTQ